MKHAFFTTLVIFSLCATASASCITAISPNFAHFDFFGADGSFAVTAPADCTYPIGSNVAWAAVTNGNSGTGNKTVTYNVSFNNTPGFRSRVGVLVVDGKTFTIVQGGKGSVFKRTLVDFNGDGNSDYAAIQNAGGQMVWWFYHFHITPGASTGTARFGLFAGDIPVPNDFDGDQKTDVAVWREGAVPGAQSYFYIFQSGSGTVRTLAWGTNGDDPKISQDFDGDALVDPAVARRQNGKLVWHIFLSATGSFFVKQFGDENDRPVRGDYDGDYHADIAVYRPAGGSPANTFFVLGSSDDAVTGTQLGTSGTDKLVPGDYDGDRKTDFAVWRSTTGDWYWIGSSGGGLNVRHFGQAGDLPAAGDYNGDSITDLAVWRPGDPGTFFVQSTGNPFTYKQVLSWGNSSMMIPANLLNSQ